VLPLARGLAAIGGGNLPERLQKIVARPRLCAPAT
jgi:hypothetical protein